jgi:hypothetical protein
MLVPFSNTAIVSNDANDANSYRCVQMSRKRINNKKKNIKVVANNDYLITISHLSYEGRRCSRTLEIPYEINFETAKATRTAHIETSGKYCIQQQPKLRSQTGESYLNE